MEWIPSLLAFMIGLSIGRYWTVLVYRFPVDKSVTRYRTVSGYGSIVYPIRVLWMGMISLLLYISFGWSLDFCKYLILALLLTAIAEIDFRLGIVPDQLVIMGSIAALVIQAFALPEMIIERLLAAFLSMVLLLFIREGSIRLFGRIGLGMGDVKLTILIALFIGWQSIWAFYLAAVIGGVVGLVGLALGKWNRTTRLPFAPFIASGVGLSTVLFPEDLINWLSIING